MNALKKNNDNRTMNIDKVEQLIDEAIKQETQSDLFIKFLQQTLSRPNQLPVSEQCDADCIFKFVVAYLKAIPEYFTYLGDYAAKAKVNDYADPLIEVAKNFFLNAKPHEGSTYSIASLLNEAYFCLRLIEETNEHIMSRCGQAFIPADITTANLVVHQLIGEPFVNELDEGVDFAIQQANENNNSLKSLNEHTISELLIKLEWADFCQQQSIEFDPLSIGQLKTG